MRPTSDQTNPFMTASTSNLETDSTTNTIFQTDDRYSDELNSMITSYNENADAHEECKQLGPATKYAFIGLLLADLLDIYIIVSRQNAGYDAEFIKSNYQIFNSQNTILRNEYSSSPNPSSDIQEFVDELEKISLEPPPPPAVKVDPLKPIKTDNIKESAESTGWRWASYGLFALSVTTGALGAAKVGSALMQGTKEVAKEGAKKVAEESAKEVAKEVAEEGLKQVAKEGTKRVLTEGAKKSFIEGGLFLTVSAASGAGSAYSKQQADTIDTQKLKKQ